LSLADARSESPPESTVRVALALAGVERPVPQYSVMRHGYFVARVDLAWPDIRFAVEYDGQWHSDRDQLTRDRRRLRELTAIGWQVYHVTRDDLGDVDRLVRNIAAAITARRSDRSR
jgi:very-short-patch-repair endonuclease